MKQYAYIEWLSFTIPDASSDMSAEPSVSLDTVAANPFSTAHFRWLVTEDVVDLAHAQYGTSDDLLAWLSSVSHPIVFIVPGEKVVARHVSYHEREKRHFAKMLPYSVEESVVDDVDNLHFVVGEKTDGQATIAYIDKQWFAQALDFFEDNQVPVSRSVIDFQCLQRTDNETIVWFDGERLLSHSATGIGFSTRDQLAEYFLSDLLSTSTANAETITSSDDAGEANIVYKVYVLDKQAAANPVSVEQVTRTFHTLAPEATSEFYTQAPILSIHNPQMINLCSGEFAPKKQSSSRGISWRIAAVLGVIAVMLFFASNGLSIFLTQKKMDQQEQAIEALVRQVIPEGVVRDPIRSLTNLLTDLGSGEQASDVVLLLSQVAPVVQSLDVELLTINYKHKEKTLRLSVQANTFNVVEQLREKIEVTGLSAELLSSNAIDNTFQARLRIRQENQ